MKSFEEPSYSSAEAEPTGHVIRISSSGGTTGVLKSLAQEHSKIDSGISFKFLDRSGSSEKLDKVQGFVDFLTCPVVKGISTQQGLLVVL